MMFSMSCDALGDSAYKRLLYCTSASPSRSPRSSSSSRSPVRSGQPFVRETCYSIGLIINYVTSSGPFVDAGKGDEAAQASSHTPSPLLCVTPVAYHLHSSVKQSIFVVQTILRLVNYPHRGSLDPIRTHHLTVADQPADHLTHNPRPDAQ